MLTPSFTILGKSCIPCDYLSFVGNVAPAYGFFYAPKSQEDSDWLRETKSGRCVDVEHDIFVICKNYFV
jgi:hypothetical protein